MIQSNLKQHVYKKNGFKAANLISLSKGNSSCVLHFKPRKNKKNNNNLLFKSLKHNGPPPWEGGGTSLNELIGKKRHVVLTFNCTINCSLKSIVN